MGSGEPARLCCIGGLVLSARQAESSKSCWTAVEEEGG